MQKPIALITLLLGLAGFAPQAAATELLCTVEEENFCNNGTCKLLDDEKKSILLKQNRIFSCTESICDQGFEIWKTSDNGQYQHYYFGGGGFLKLSLRKNRDFVEVRTFMLATIIAKGTCISVPR